MSVKSLKYITLFQRICDISNNLNTKVRII